MRESSFKNMTSDPSSSSSSSSTDSNSTSTTQQHVKCLGAGVSENRASGKQADYCYGWLSGRGRLPGKYLVNDSLVKSASELVLSSGSFSSTSSSAPHKEDQGQSRGDAFDICVGSSYFTASKFACNGLRIGVWRGLSEENADMTQIDEVEDAMSLWENLKLSDNFREKVRSRVWATLEAMRVSPMSIMKNSERALSRTVRKMRQVGEMCGERFWKAWSGGGDTT